MAGEGRRTEGTGEAPAETGRPAREGRLQEEMRQNLLKRKRQQRQRAGRTPPAPVDEARES